MNPELTENRPGIWSARCIAIPNHYNPKPQRGGMYIANMIKSPLKPQRGDMCEWTNADEYTGIS